MSEQQLFYEQKLKYEIDSWDLNEALKNGENILVIDARSEGAYDREHIPHSISLPHRNMTEENTQYFDKNMVYVSYCDGIGCNASTKGALNMAKLGFNVKELIGGIDWWKKDGYETHGSEAEPCKEEACGC